MHRDVDSRIWGDQKFRKLSHSGKLVWFYLLTGPQTMSLPGIFEAGEARMAEDLEMTLELFRESFREVFQLGLVMVDWKARVVVIPNAPKYNPPHNPNILKSWAKQFDVIPECELKNKYYQILKSFIESLGESFAKSFRESFPKPTPNHSQNQPEIIPETNSESFPKPSRNHSRNQPRIIPQTNSKPFPKPSWNHFLLVPIPIQVPILVQVPIPIPVLKDMRWTSQRVCKKPIQI